MFSKACEYGIKATICITKNTLAGNRVMLKEIAEKIETPEAFTAKILQDLARNKIVKSIKGPYGGFEMERDKIKTTTLRQVVDAIDGPQVYEGCGLGLSNCNDEKPCPIHNKFAEIRGGLQAMLSQTTIYDLAQKVDAGEAFLAI